MQALFALEGIKEPRFGRKDEVEPISWLFSTAAGWGGNPQRDAMYLPFFPKNSDGKAAYTVKVKDVPVDGFWSITMYDAKGFTSANQTLVFDGKDSFIWTGKDRLIDGECQPDNELRVVRQAPEPAAE